MGERLFKLIRGARGTKPTISAGPVVSETITAQRLAMCSTPDARALVPYEFSKKHDILPLGIICVRDRLRLTAAVPIGKSLELERILRFLCEKDVQLIELSEELIRQAIFISYHRDDSALQRSLEQFQRCESAGSAKELLPFRPNAGEAGIFLAALVDYSIAQGASDIHLIPLVDGLHVKLRINGDLRVHNGPVCNLGQYKLLVSRIKLLAGLDHTQKQLAYDGRISVPVANGTASLRVSTMPTIHGEKVVLRIIGAGSIPEYTALGYDPHILSLIDRLLLAPSGMVIAAGPTGSGKSTSLYSLALALHARGLSIASIEDPVETALSGISQTSISAQDGFDFAAALKAVLRQDPDVILVGEIRDIDTARVAFQAALAGRLVLTTVHAGSVLEVFFRLQSLDVPAVSLAQGVKLVIWQRLIPVLCDRCKVVDLAGSESVNTEVFRPAGCSHCDYSGWGGRQLLAEALVMNDALREILLKSGVGAELFCWKKSIGEENFRQSTLDQLLRQGRITLAQRKLFSD